MATGELNELYLRRRRTAYDKFIDSSFKNVAITMASMVALILVAILIVVFWGSNESMGRYGLKFLVTSSWNPVDDKYGIATAVYGTIITSLLSLLIAIPLGVGTAVFITENIVPTKIRNIIGVFVELLAAIPSVVLGLWAIFVMVPLLKPILTLLYKLFNWIPFFSSEPIGPGLGITPAILILVVMILPIITAISRDSLNQVPINLREAAYGVGATRWGAITNVMLPAAFSGITGGV
ncbi:MAG: PstC family ABC transporter permease, partial [Prochlorococcus sp.]